MNRTKRRPTGPGAAAAVHLRERADVLRLSIVDPTTARLWAERVERAADAEESDPEPDMDQGWWQ